MIPAIDECFVILTEVATIDEWNRRYIGFASLVISSPQTISITSLVLTDIRNAHRPIAHDIIPRQNAPMRRVGREAILQITLRTDTNAFSTVQTYEEKPPFRSAHTARNAQQAILSRALVLCVNGVFDGYESKKHRVAKDLESGMAIP